MAIIESASTDVLLEREEALAQLHEAFARPRRAGAASSSSAVRRASERRRSSAGSATSCRAGRPSSGVGATRWRRRGPLGPFLEIAERAGAAIDGVLDPWSAAHDVAAGLLELRERPARRSSSSSRTRTGRTRARWTCCGCSVGGTPTTRVSRARHLPRRRARARPSAPRRARRSLDRRVRRAARGSAALPRRRRTARRGHRRRRRHRLAPDVGQSVLRQRSSSRTARTRSRLRCATSCSRGSRSSAHRRPPSSRRRRSRRPRSTRRSCSRCAARRPTPSTSASRAAFSTRSAAASHSATSSRARPSRSRCRRPGDLRCTARVLLALTDSPRAGADLARIAHHAEEAADARGRASVRTRGRRAGSEGRCVPRGGGPVRARAPLRRRPRRPETAPTLLEGRSRACYLADDQTEAIEVIREAIRCRQAAGRPARGGARAHRAHRLPLVPRLQRRGGRRRSTARRNSLRGDPSSASTRTSSTRRPFEALYRGDVDGCLEHARRALEIGERFGDAAHRRSRAGHDRQRHGTQRPRRTACASSRKPSRPRGGTASTRSPHEGLNALVLRPMPWNRHDLVERYIDDAIEYCTEHTQDLWRINVQAVAARWALDRGRWDDAVRHAGAVIDDPRESPWTHHEALCVLALVRARRGDPGARDALAEAAAVGVPVGGALRPRGSGGGPRRDRVARARRWADVDAATAAMLAGAVEPGDPEAVARLLFWRRLAGLEVDVPEPTARGRTRSRSPAAGRRPPTSGRG